MRHISPPESLEIRARKYLDQIVKDTHGRVGLVYQAHPNKAKGVIELWVDTIPVSDTYWITDNEHCTIVRDMDV